MATSNNSLGLLINAQTIGGDSVDKLAQSIGRLSTTFEQAGAKAKEQTSSFDSFAASVKQGISDPLGAAGNVAESFLKTLGPVGVGLGVAGAGFAAFGASAIASMKSLGELGTQIENISIRTGLSTKEVGQFSFAAKAAGSDIGAFETAMRTLSKGLSDNSEDGKKARQALADMGITARDSSGQLRPMSEIFLEISKGLSGMTDVANRNTAGIALMGRSWLELAPVMMSLNENVQRAKELGLGVDEDSIQQWKKYHEQMTEVDFLWQKLKREFEQPLAAVLSVTLKWLTDGPKRDLRDRESFSFADFFGGRDNASEDAMEGGFVSGMFGKMGPKSPSLDVLRNPDRFAQNEAAPAYAKGVQNAAHLDALRGAFGATKEGIQEALSQAKKDLKDARDALFSGDLSQESTVNTKASDVARLTARLEAMNAADKGGTWVYREGANTPQRSMVPSLYGPQWGGTGASDVLSISESDITRANSGAESASAEQLKAYAQGLLELEKDREDQVLENEKKIAEQRKKSEEEIADLRQQAEDKYVETVTRAFDALTSGKSGAVTSFFMAQLKGLENTVVGNVARMSYKGISEHMPSITSDSDNFLGKLLKGTPFEKSPGSTLDPAGTKLNMAGDKLIQAASALSMSRTGGGGGYVGGSGDYLNSIGINPDTGDFYDSDDQGWGLSDSESAAANPFTGVGSDDDSDLDSGGGMSLGAGIGIAGAGVGGIMGLLSGIKEGNAQGVAKAGGSVAGAAGAIMGLAGVSGPAAPIMMGVGLALGMVTAMFGDPRTNRENDITKAVQNSQYIAPQAIHETMSMGGTYSDYDRSGNLRTSNLSPVPQIQEGYWDSVHKVMVPGRVTSPFGGGASGTVNLIVNGDMLDSDQFFQKHGEAAANALYAKIQGGHPIVTALQDRLGIH
jgi:hypothetical protein